MAIFLIVGLFVPAFSLALATLVPSLPPLLRLFIPWSWLLWWFAFASLGSAYVVVSSCGLCYLVSVVPLLSGVMESLGEELDQLIQQTASLDWDSHLPASSQDLVGASSVSQLVLLGMIVSQRIYSPLPFMDRLISSAQNAFIPYRHIQENSILVHEILRVPK